MPMNFVYFIKIIKYRFFFYLSEFVKNLETIKIFVLIFSQLKIFTPLRL